jgi:hypothetical protein
MNIDDLKDAWNKDEPSGMHLPMSAAMLGKTSSAVGKIRKNMKSEFIATLIIYPLMFGFLFIHQQNVFFLNATCILLFTIMVLNAYYVFRFYVFYKSIGRYDLNMKNSVYKVAYELELNTELYKALNYCITPLMVLASFGLVCSKRTSNYIQHILTANTVLSPLMLLLVFFIILIVFIAMYIWINWYIRCLYGKYLAELKQIMDDLGTED